MDEQDRALPPSEDRAVVNGAASVSALRASVPSAVVFLDFDGVICSPRAYVAQAERWFGDQRPLRWADQVACDLVVQLLRKHGAKLVISSTWRHMVDSCHKVLGRYDLTPFLHDDWRTGEDPERMRGREIADWLARNDNPPFVILDDDSDFTPVQMPWLVNTCGLNGMMLADHQKADALLAQAIEARRAETGTGSVHESAVPKGCAQ